MKTTKNLGLNMPDANDFVEIDKINKNTEKIDEELAKKADASGGDISETVITSTETSQAEYPVPAAGDSAKTVLGKVQKFFADIRDWMTGVCLLGQIVNNCVTDNAKLPLSAAQGKVLMDLYNVLNTNLQNAVKTNSTAWLSRVELKDGIPLIDFHFNNSPEDYTSRIIEDLSGSLNIVSDLRINDRYPVTSENSRIRFRNQGGFLMGRIDDLDLGGVVTISGHYLKFVWDAGTKRIYVWMDSTNLGYLNILS